MVVLQTPRGIRWISRGQMPQKGQTHKTPQCPLDLENGESISRNGGGEEGMDGIR